MSEIYIPRRKFIQTTGLVLAGSCFMPQLVWGAAKNAEKRLKLYNIHTGEHLNEVFWAEGKFIPETLKSLNKFFRDWRTDQVAEICPKLYQLMHDIYAKMDPSKPFHIISGYRSPKTNESLRKKSKKVAKKSRHLTGHAIDLSIPGASLKNLRNCAMSFRAGGVGYYPARGFVHVDIRDKPTIW
jgi:uncharacterized protein YcbK (DUF882 family)